MSDSDYEWYIETVKKVRPEEWEPGVPLGFHPWAHYDPELLVPTHLLGGGPPPPIESNRQYIRCMIELVADEVSPAVVGYSSGSGFMSDTARICVECQVGWDEAPSCWMCGGRGESWAKCRAHEGRWERTREQTLWRTA